MQVECDRHDVEQGLRNDAPIRGNHEGVGTVGPRFGCERAQCDRRDHPQAARSGGLFHRRCGQAVTAARGAIRLGDDRDHVVAPGNRFECRDGERTRPENDELQRAPAATASASATSSSVRAGRRSFALSM